MALKQEMLDTTPMIVKLQEYLNATVLKEHTASLERFSTEFPAIRMKAMKELVKQDVNILGEYTGIYTFGIEIRISKLQDPSTVYHLFDLIESFLIQAKKDQTYPVLGSHTKCQNIQLSSYPVLQQRLEDGTEDYLAIYSVTFRKLSNYE